MSKYIKNDSGVTKTYAGKEMADQEIYQLSFDDEYRWAKFALDTGTNLNADITSGDAKVSKDGVTFMSAADGLSYMKQPSVGTIKDNMVMPNPTDNQLLQYNATTEKWECVDADSITSLKFYSAWLNKDVESNLGMYFDCGPASNTWIKQTSWMEGDDYGGLVTRSSVPIDNFIAGGDDKIVITGDYTSYFKNDNSVRIINSALNDGMYSIRDDSVLNAGKTEIQIDGDVPDDAATDGDVLLGDFNVTAAGAGWLEITLTMSVNANNFNLWVAFFKNDVQVDQLTSLIHPTGSGDNQIFHMKYYLNCAENDKLDIRFKNDQTNKEGWIEYAQLLFRKL